jgi:hypothetical protein
MPKIIKSHKRKWWRATLQADSQARTRLEVPKTLGVGDLWQVKK